MTFCDAPAGWMVLGMDRFLQRNSQISQKPRTQAPRICSLPSKDSLALPQKETRADAQRLYSQIGGLSRKILTIQLYNYIRRFNYFRINYLDALSLSIETIFISLEVGALCVSRIQIKSPQKNTTLCEAIECSSRCGIRLALWCAFTS